MGSCDVAAGSAEETGSFDRLSSAWSPIGTATVKAARLRPGAHVLGTWCGSGPSAIPAAEQAGPHRVIDAADLAEPRSSGAAPGPRSAVRGPDNVRFVRGDVLDWPVPPGGDDAVMCSPGISSSPDAEAGAERLLRLMRPGGRLTVAVWSQGALEPLPEPIRRAVVPERPCLADVPRPARLPRPVGTPRPFRDWLAARSLSCTDVRYVPLAVPGVLRSVVSGTGRRGLLDGMGLPFELP